MAGDESKAVGGAHEAIDRSESRRLFRLAGMKNAAMSPVRPWLLTALRRVAEAAPDGERRRLLRRANVPLDALLEAAQLAVKQGREHE